MFVWGASVFFAMARPPADTLNIYVVGKQWMWKFQHLDGAARDQRAARPGRPAGQADHDLRGRDPHLFVPAFRVKEDVVPGRYTHVWFEATKPGSYHLFCAEYCGTQHSGMIG